MRITADWTIHVSAPFTVSDNYIQHRIASKKQWIEKTLHRISQNKQHILQKNQCVLFGEIYTRTSLATTPIDTVQKTIHLPPWTTQNIRLRSLATSYLHKKMTYWQQKHQCVFQKLFIRSQKTKRWTCSSKKHISLNRKLITLPERIIDYVICHELAHLTHMNHSKAFRTHCQDLYPQTYEAKQWLKNNGHHIA